MRFAAVAVAVAATVLGPAGMAEAPAGGDMAMAAGTTVILAQREGMLVREPDGLAIWSDEDLKVAGIVAAIVPPVTDPQQTAGVVLHPPRCPVTAGQLRFRMMPQRNGHTFMIIENGLPYPVHYSARFRVEGTEEPTDVCIIPPGVRGVEHWPSGIERLTIGNVRPAVLPPDGSVPCF